MSEKILRDLAERLVHKEWYVLGPPWCGYSDTFTILAGSPDPHVAEPILETLPIEDADEDEDHYRQDALAQWLQFCDPNAVLTLLDTLDTQSARIAELEAELAEARELISPFRTARIRHYTTMNTIGNAEITLVFPGQAFDPKDAFYAIRAFMEGQKDG